MQLQHGDDQLAPGGRSVPASPGHLHRDPDRHLHRPGDRPAPLQQRL